MSQGIVPPDGQQPKIQLPVGVHGFYLPNIQKWNDHLSLITRNMPDSFEMMGSVDDHVLEGGDGICGHCGAELVRMLLTKEIYFLGGAIYCSNKNEDMHPKEYWVEIWPDANMKLTKGQETALDDTTYHENLFILSSPIIKPCYCEEVSFFHRRDPESNPFKTRPFAGPLFRHE